MKSGRQLVFYLLPILAGCSTSPETLPNGAVVLPAADIPAVLHQCSRGTPASGEGSWTPGLRDIQEFEAALPGFIAKSEVHDDDKSDDWAHAPHGWVRQYIGIVRHGRHYLYGNFAPAEHPFATPNKPMAVCDGGPSFFGAEYDMTGKRFTQFSFNGAA